MPAVEAFCPQTLESLNLSNESGGLLPEADSTFEARS
jgi:hypothetical protein